jgi:hypothetical protein
MMLKWKSKDKVIEDLSAAGPGMGIRQGLKYSPKEYTECEEMSGRFTFPEHDAVG